MALSILVISAVGATAWTAPALSPSPKTRHRRSSSRSSSQVVRRHAESSSSPTDISDIANSEPNFISEPINGCATVNGEVKQQQQQHQQEKVEADPSQIWREKIQALAFRTQCGFKATPTDRQRMKYLIQQLAAYNPTPEPAAVFYDKDQDATAAATPSLQGKWTLVYTDAPDILTLADNDTFARLQRIGQECGHGKIANVIEWVPPVWAGALPVTITGNTQGQRVLQKVITQASASPDQLSKVTLVLKGLQVEWLQEDSSDNIEGVLPSLWSRVNPLQLQGPLTAPFGSFEVLYLDEEMRIIRTNQGFYAINRRNSPETDWF